MLPTRLRCWISNTLQRSVRFDRVYNFAIQIYKDAAAATELLNKPHQMLEMQVPVDVAVSSDAAADVGINQLGRGAYGGGV
jgi:putative toxin-antitoxin system antitoxin component (TIGR02293 family)